MIQSPATDSSNDRDAKGRFAKGNQGGPGNPHAGQVAKLRARMLEAVTEDQVKQAMQALADEAARGNVAAIRELLDRVAGKPHQAQSHEITGPGGEPIQGPAQSRPDLESLSVDELKQYRALLEKMTQHGAEQPEPAEPAHTAEPTP
jgi:hypothetical protein